MSQMKITVHTQQKKDVLGDFYGIFFEDLNHAADGGLYAELVRNRAFEFDPVDNASYTHMTGWEVIGTEEEIHARVLTGKPVSEKNPHYLVLDVHKPRSGAGIQNEGFHHGIVFCAGAGYDFSCWAKREQDLEEAIVVSLRDSEGEIFAQQKIFLTTEWKKYELVLVPQKSTKNGRLALTVEGRGKVYLDFVSLFPQDTYKGRKGGLRRDLAEFLENLHPKFMRFPGGCLIHDGALDPDARDAQYRWKNTIGPIENRPARRNNWGYNQTLGLGFFELFQFCEDIGAKPLPVISPGYDPHHHREVPLDHMQYFIDEALDLIEFANGSMDSKWGGLRAKLGHPEPFHLEYLGIGNEEVGEAFFGRYNIVAQAIRARYPKIKLIGTSGPNAAGSEYERGWRHAKEGLCDLVDEHYYQSPEWFVANHNRYASFSGDEPGVFLGEYASKGNTWKNALYEASFMIGLEECASAVKLACYAPLLCSANHVNWKPNMIWFDKESCFGTANYYVQKLFMEYQGQYTLPLEKIGFPDAECFTPHPDKIIGSIVLGNYNSTVEYRDIVLTRKDGEGKILADSCSIRKNGESMEIALVEEGNYSLTLRAVEKEGFQGFRIYFGVEGENDRFCWTIGGWQNQDTVITERVNGMDSDLSQCLISVEREKEYTLKLVVDGRRIRTYIDEQLYHDIEAKPVEMEPLYIAAAEDGNGDILIKAVNLTEENRETELFFQGMGDGTHPVKGSILCGWQLQEENSFAEPEKIVPGEFEMKFAGERLEWKFPANSVTMLRIGR